MAVQTHYSATLGAGRPGAIADMQGATIVSRNAEVDAIGFGLPVAQGADDNGIHKAKSGDTAIFGISVRDRSATGDEYAVGDSVRVLRRGVIWVTAAAAVTAGDPVHVTADATFTNTGGVAINGARYDSSGASGTLVKVRLGQG